MKLNKLTLNIKTLGFCVGFLVFIIVENNAQTYDVFEAEAATLSGTANIATCGTASGGEMVKDINSGSSNALLFENISIPEAGRYYVTLSYLAVNKREVTYELNNVASTKSISASGLWCYQEGFPADFTFEETFDSGNNELLFYDAPIIDKIVISSDTASRSASTFYISASSGSDENDGLSATTAWKSLYKLNAQNLVPGDSILFKSGDTFNGKLEIINEGGVKEMPVTISRYDEGEVPVLNGDGYLSTIHIVNSGYLTISNMEITNNGGPAKQDEPEEIRYGMFIENSRNDGTIYKHFRLTNLVFKNIYPTINVTDDDQTGVNAHAIITSGSWGDEEHPFRFRDMVVEGCYFTRTARNAAVFKAIDSLIIQNNRFEHVGGAGMVIGNNCSNILVENNVTEHTGSSIDERMAGRGSGIWCFRTKNLTVQHNKFMYARGIKDSYGMHIDIGNKNVVYQYNYSEGNEGGFVEILGANVNVGYRYNISINDRWRTRGNQHGKTFWISGWSGEADNPVGSDSIFIYNNSIFVSDTITPGIHFVFETRWTRIYNNIIYVKGDFGPVNIENYTTVNDFDNNLWYGNIPQLDEDGETYRGSSALHADPLLHADKVTEASDLKLQPGSPAIGAGKPIHEPTTDHPYDYFHNNGGEDYFGNPVSHLETPNIGAYNGDGMAVHAPAVPNKNHMKLYPNPVHLKQPFAIEIPEGVDITGLRIQVLDSAGRVLLQESNVKNVPALIDSSKLPLGNYLIKVMSENYLETGKLLVL